MLVHNMRNENRREQFQIDTKLYLSGSKLFIIVAEMVGEHRARFLETEKVERMRY